MERSMALLAPSLRRGDLAAGGALFPPGKGGGEGVAYGYKGKGILIHTLTEGNGMPISNCTTAANGNERDQIIPLLDRVKLKTIKRGRPRKRVKVLAADKGYDSQEKRALLRKRGIRPQLPKRNYKGKKKPGRPIKISVPRFRTAKDVLVGISVNIVVLLSDGSVKKTILMLFYF